MWNQFIVYVKKRSNWLLYAGQSKTSDVTLAYAQIWWSLVNDKEHSNYASHLLEDGNKVEDNCHILLKSA